jgi:hypothetical protein
MKKLKKSQAKSHVTINKNNKVTYEKGEPLEFNAQHALPQEGFTLVGLSKGITKNLGDYESARVDCWMSSTVEHLKAVDALEEMSSLIDDTIDQELTAIAKALRGR